MTDQHFSTSFGCPPGEDPVPSRLTATCRARLGLTIGSAAHRTSGLPLVWARALIPVPNRIVVSLIPRAPSATRRSLLESVPHTLSADILAGLWVTCYEFNSDGGIGRHADISRITPQSSRRVTAKNYPPDPRTQGHVPSFRNEIEAQLANRHLIGHWRNISDTRYFGSIHLAVLPGEAVMQGYYTGFSTDIEVDAMRWKWVRLDPASLSGVELAQVVLKEPDVIYALLEHSAHEAPLTLGAVVEGT